jgi:hypothetical protein
MGRAPALALIPVGLCGVSTLLGIVTAASVLNPVFLGVAVLFGGLTILVGTISMLIAIGFLLWIGLTPGSITDDQLFTGGLRR